MCEEKPLKTYAISEQTMTTLAIYLAQRPYGEVAEIVAAIENDVNSGQEE